MAINRDLGFFRSLLESVSPSSNESEALEVWEKYLGTSSLYYSDKIGNIAFSLGSGPKKVLLSAHIDEIAMAVQCINEDGTLGIVGLAGIDKKVLPGSQIIVITETGNKVGGIIQKSPIHIEGREKKLEEVCKIENLKLDVGAESKEEIESLGIEIGNLCVFQRNINLEFGKNRLYGNALDDKVGIYIISQVWRELKDSVQVPSYYTLIFCATTQEESGLRGATVAAKNINPDVSIDIDVTFANENKSVYGDIKLGKGPVLGYGQDKSRRLIKEFKNFGIPYQTNVARCGGTNTDAIQLGASDCETLLISIPNLSMHTQNETCDWRDIEGCIDMIVKSIKEGIL